MDTERPDEPRYRVVVGSFGDGDHGYRLVWLRGVGWEPVAEKDLERRVREVFPDIDLSDPEQVHWVGADESWPAAPRPEDEG
ncbi:MULTISPECIES: hypothetical protein [unclassified Streptomyces]|uniref:hypothetical protein n=1 Tax=unclassified Streptomyces TaxID=2593676 RepID=UPI0022B64B61|nr:MULTISPECIES: hypothetical protein [unclassified Streptomyces]MCZ7414014.1 hypothetical protein [Streptomyces sp. WMMC897]MCZ7431009.1 hypothetical protein [Streptomyces sp. WMMC1477]